MKTSSNFLVSGRLAALLVIVLTSLALRGAVPERWALKEFCGRDFWPLFQPDYWSVTNSVYHNDNPLGRTWPPLSVWFDTGTLVTTYEKPVPTLKRMWGRGYAGPWDGKPESVKHPTKFLDFFNKRQRGFVESPEKGERPYFIELHGLGMPFYYIGEYDFDQESFRRWKAEHPGFVGFRMLSEFDYALHVYGLEVPKMTNETLKAQLVSKFGAPTKMYTADADPQCFLSIVRKLCEATKPLLFGEHGFWSMNSSCLSMPHKAAEFGAEGLFYEATSQGCARWQVAGAFLRGASRQYRIPFAWYTATWCNGFTREGESKCGANSLKATANPSHWPLMGAGRNSTKRMINYAWLAGASFMETEGPHRTHYARVDDEKPPTVPSDFALDMEELWQRSQKEDRGVVYTPCAILTPLSLFMMSSSSMPYGGGQFTYHPFFYTLCPINSADGAQRDLRRRGKQSCLFNSKFGEFYDVLVADTKRGDFADALSAYRAAFLIGDYRKEELRLDALSSFVENGGTLFVGAEQLINGNLPFDFTGVRLGSAVTASRGWPETYEWHLADELSDGAKPWRKDDAGAVIAYTRHLGKGRIVTVTAERFLPAEYLKLKGNQGGKVDEICAGKRRFSLIDRLLSDVQQSTMPILVKGDVQWGVNVTQGGYLVWLINNNGVTKFTYEPEEFDSAATAEVEIDATKLGLGIRKESVAPGEIKLLRIPR